MEKIEVKIGWNGNNYSCITDNEALNGIILVTDKTIEGLKKSFIESLNFHIEGCINDNDVLQEWLLTGNYEIEYFLETSALIHKLDNIITRSAIARVSGINERQIKHYASGQKTPRKQQRERIINAVHTISNELASVV